MKNKIKGRKIADKKALMKEMYSCKECECASFPWCSKFGSLCKECVDLSSYIHKRPLRNNPGRYAIDPESSHSIPNDNIDYPYIQVLKTSPNGDCLYKSISIAFDGLITVEDLRHLVARYQTQTTFDMYKELSKFMPEFRPIKGTSCLRDFRILIKKTGGDIGIGNCVWGDENSLQIISTSLRLGIMIFNEKGKFMQSLNPEPIYMHENTIPRRYILLLLNNSKAGNEHYNLLKFNNNTLLTDYEIQKMNKMLSLKKDAKYK